MTTALNSLLIFFFAKHERRSASVHCARGAAQPTQHAWSLLGLLYSPYRHAQDLLDRNIYSSRLQQLQTAWNSNKTYTIRLHALSFQTTVRCSALAKTATVFFLLQVVLVLPAVITHILPALCLYGWILLAAYALWCLGREVFLGMLGAALAKRAASSIIQSDRDDVLIVFRHLSHLLSMILQRCIFIFIMQTLFNYAALFYIYGDGTNEDYFGIVSHEFRLRSQSYCFFNSLPTTAVRGTIMLLSWL